MTILALVIPTAHTHLCPWWVGHLLAHPLRRVLHAPGPIVAPFVAEGMTVLEPGPGMGYFTVELARRVGPLGRVIAVDLQPQMLVGAGRRLRAAALLDRVELRQADPERMGLDDLRGKVGFVLAFAMVHEVRNVDAFFAELAPTLAPEGRVLIAEPRVHVTEAAFAATLTAAHRAGLVVAGTPRIPWSRAAMLRR